LRLRFISGASINAPPNLVLLQAPDRAVAMPCPCSLLGHDPRRPPSCARRRGARRAARARPGEQAVVRPRAAGAAPRGAAAAVAPTAAAAAAEASSLPRRRECDRAPAAGGGGGKSRPRRHGGGPGAGPAGSPCAREGWPSRGARGGGAAEARGAGKRGGDGEGARVRDGEGCRGGIATRRLGRAAGAPVVVVGGEGAACAGKTASAMSTLVRTTAPSLRETRV